MTKEDKQLLLKVLCEMLPCDDIYGEVHMQIVGESKPFIVKEKPITFDDVKDFMNEDGVIFNIKPYLRPMSSMTEKEREEYNILVVNYEYDDYYYPGAYIDAIVVSDVHDLIDFYNEHHFDYRGLIEKGLALEAPDGMYNIEN